MACELMALGAVVASSDCARAPAAERLALEQGLRASLLCTLIGVEREGWVWPYPRRAAGLGATPSPASRLLAGLFESLGGIGQLATLAGAADLDPMDPGPSHSVLPATLAACVAAGLGDAAGGDEHIASGVLAGIEAAWRLRRSISGARPGIGFHSAGVFGAVAAAAAGARVLALDATGCTNAIAIALTRASGLAINSAASMIGMTHFGWGSLHGLEAALLAAEGWDASHDVERALASLFGEGRVDVAAITAARPGAASALVFKRYPCNIYLNLVATMLDEVTGVAEQPVDRVQITMPWIPHLDCAAPRDLRQARNSAQAVAAIVGAGDASYAAFSGPPGPWQPSAAVRRLLANVELVVDRDAPTRLSEALVGVRAWRGRALVQDSTRAMQDLRGWGAEHARRLLGDDEMVAVLYGASVSTAFEHIDSRRRLADSALVNDPRKADS